MALTVTELADEVRDTNRRLTAAIDGLRDEVGDLRVQVAEINTNLRWAKGLVRIIAGSTMAVAILVGTGVYRFGRVENAIAELQTDTRELRLELRNETGELRKETAELRKDIVQLSKDTTELRAELRKETAELRKDIAQVGKDTAELRRETAEIRSDMKARDDRLNGTLGRIEKALPAASKGNP